MEIKCQLDATEVFIADLVVCGQTQEVSEIMRQTLIHGALNLERLGRHGTFKSSALCLER